MGRKKYVPRGATDIHYAPEEGETTPIPTFCSDAKGKRYLMYGRVIFVVKNAGVGQSKRLAPRRQFEGNYLPTVSTLARFCIACSTNRIPQLSSAARLIGDLDGCTTRVEEGYVET